MSNPASEQGKTREPGPEADAASAPRLAELVERGQRVMAHGWMIRTFIKHCDEVEDFPELNEMARTIFDAFRAVETQTGSPAEYFKTLRKKLGKLRAAAEQYAKDAWTASTHTNFQQSIIASRFLGEQLQEILSEADRLLPRPVAPKFVLPGRSPSDQPQPASRGSGSPDEHPDGPSST
jgi:hypothetical protein